MSRPLQTAVALLAIAALAAGVLGTCVCVAPAAAKPAHDCCDRGGGPVLSASRDCCAGAPASGASAVAVASVQAAPAAPADALLVAPAATVMAAPRLASSSSSSPPLILRI